MENKLPFPISNPVEILGLGPASETAMLPQSPPFQVSDEVMDIPTFPYYTKCNLTLKQGCYKISMDSNLAWPSKFQQNFQGTIRVQNNVDQNGNLSHAISGDLYRKPVFPGLSLPARPDNVLDGAQKIPIYPRNRYHSYLKVVGIKKTLFIKTGQKCQIELTAEEYKYTPPANDSTHGNFSTIPSRTLRIVLEKATSPSGSAGPYFEGKVYQGATELPVSFRMEWVSGLFRRASLEVESVVGAAIPASAGTHNFQSIYATAGWDLTVKTGDINLPVPAGVSATDPWSEAELHAFMLANRNPAINLDVEWKYYYLAVPFDSTHPGIFGIMFDQVGDHREGSCNFINNMTGNFGDAYSKLRSAAHEIGHGFNQLHPQDESPDLALENYIMTQSGSTRNAILNAGGIYPDDIRFEFSPHHRHHLIHAPDLVVRPGGEDFGFGHSDVLPGSRNPEDADLAKEIGLSLTIDTERNHIKLGEPLQLKIELRNDGRQAVQVPQSISWATTNTNISAGQIDGNARAISSFVHICDSTGLATLDPGENMFTNELVYWDTNGFVFTQPGVHTVEVSIHWDVDGIGYSLSEAKYIWVDYPVTAKENQIAAALMHPEVGKYVALGGNAYHLKTAVKRIADAARLDKNHPGYDCITQMNTVGEKVLNRQNDLVIERSN